MRFADAKRNKGDRKRIDTEISLAANAMFWIPCHKNLSRSIPGKHSISPIFPWTIGEVKFHVVKCYFAVANCASSWHVATAEVASAYKAFSVERIMGRVGVYIGLDHANITLDAMPIYYNEVTTGRHISWRTSVGLTLIWDVPQSCPALQPVRPISHQPGRPKISNPNIV